LILGKITKIVATRCHTLKPKCTKFDFGWGSVPDPVAELLALPQHPRWIYTSNGRKGRKDGREGQGGEGRGEDLLLRQGEGRGKGEVEGDGCPRSILPSEYRYSPEV